MTHRRGLKPFAYQTTCIKCGATDMHPARYQGIFIMGGHVEDEHLSRHCRFCGYEWPEACLDTPADDLAKTIKKEPLP